MIDYRNDVVFSHVDFRFDNHLQITSNGSNQGESAVK